MTIYAVTRKSDHVEVYRYVAAQVMETEGYTFDLYDHTEVPDTPIPQPPYSGTWHITKLAFRNRFTQAEKVAIEIAALDNPAAAMTQRAQAAALRASQQDLAVALYIDLTRPETRAGVQARRWRAAGCESSSRVPVRSQP